MTVLYLHLTYEAYKDLEDQCRDFVETTHVSTPGSFYHKSWRISIGSDLVIEFHAPLVGGDDHQAIAPAKQMEPILERIDHTLDAMLKVLANIEQRQ